MQQAMSDAQPDEPSAADYNPTMDMREDQMRNDQRQQNGDDVSAGMYDETKTEAHDVLLVAPDAAAKKTPKKKDDEVDMFADEDENDMFAAKSATPVEGVKADRATVAEAVIVPKQLDMSMLDDWDDHEGYYRVILGELLEGRYHVQANLGKGMFSSVVRATDSKEKKLVAIKIIRNNETMYVDIH